MGPTEAAATAEPSAHFRYRPTIAQSLRVSAWNFRRAPINQASAGITVGGGLALALMGQTWGLALLVLGLSFASGFFIVPFAWILLRQRPDLATAEVELTADRTGVTIATPISTGSLSWSAFRRAREGNDAFLLDLGISQAMFIPKRGAETGQLDALRTLLQRAGLLRVDSPRHAQKLVAVFLSGAVILPGLALVVLSQRPVPNASISLDPTIQGRAVTIRGTTDLPDGSEVAVQLIQRDEYDKARAAGAAPDPATSPWILLEYARVQGGAFVAAFDVAGWPSGRGEAWAYFWVHSGQPPEAAQKFGTDGELLRGPYVYAGDNGRTLRVSTALRLE
jgi:hypothetical protein